MWKFPLKNYPYEIPLLEKGDKGAFAYERKYHVHEGVDLYAEDGDPVFCMEDGVVEHIKPFTGEIAGSPWWNNTFAVFIKSATGLVVYGEVDPNPALKIGDSVKAGDEIALVRKVLKKYKGNPMSMLHLELYEDSIEDAVSWKPKTKKPKGLLDPTNYLLAALLKKRSEKKED